MNENTIPQVIDAKPAYWKFARGNPIILNDAWVVNLMKPKKRWWQRMFTTKNYDEDIKALKNQVQYLENRFEEELELYARKFELIDTVSVRMDYIVVAHKFGFGSFFGGFRNNEQELDGQREQARAKGYEFLTRLRNGEEVWVKQGKAPVADLPDEENEE